MRTKITTVLSFLLLLFSFSAFAQEVQISGTVTSSEDGLTLPGVSIIVVGTTTGTSTDFDGNYSITAEVGQKLQFNFIGFLDHKFTVVGNDGSMNVVMKTDARALDEVVVTGYGVKKKSTSTAAASLVTAEMIKERPIASVDNLLQGQSSGVQVTSENGRPGATAYVKIRGTGSINAGNEPLFVIDGVPSDAVAYNRLNPNDVERMDVLKDAAAASIYGSRGSNGVIVITTKRGKAGAPKLSYSFMYGVKKKTSDNFDMMDTPQKLQYEYDFGKTNQYVSQYMGDNGYGSMYDIPQDELQALWNVLEGQSHDWQETLLRDAIVQSHEISLSGGADKLSYYFSTSFYDEEGISYGSDYSRITSRLNLDYQAMDWFKIGNTMSVGFTEEKTLRDRNNVQNPFSAMYSYNNYEPEYNADGTFNKTHQGFSISEAIENNTASRKYLNFQGTVFGEITPMDNLSLKTQVGLNFLNRQGESYMKPGSILDEYVGDPAAPGSKTDNGYYRYTTVWTNTASYLWEMGEDHSFNALAGTEATEEVYTSYTLSSKGWPSDKLTTQDNASEATNASTSKNDWALFSIFGSLSYSYQGKYNVEGSIRRDGSSRFGTNNKYGVFWATSAAWNIHKESFLEDSDFLNLLKLRASFGTSGNMNIDNYASIGLFQFGSYNDVSTMLATQLANPDLTWERNRNWSIGLDYGLFDNRLRGSIDYYQRKTFDLLLFRPLSMTVGFGSRLENIGEMLNKGIELDASYDIIRNDDITWNIGGNVSFNKNTITKLYDGEPINRSFHRFEEGEDYGSFYLVRWAGVNPANGEPLYYTKDGEVTNSYNGDDAVLLDKTFTPTYFGNLNSRVSYLGFDASIEFYFQGGNYIQNLVYGNQMSDGGSISGNQSADMLDYWQKPGDVSENPNPVSARFDNNNSATDRFLEDGSYIRLRNVQLGYSLKQEWIEKMYMKEFRVYVNANNLWRYSPNYHGDPEVGIGSDESDLTYGGEASLFSYPMTYGITFGANISF